MIDGRNQVLGWAFPTIVLSLFSSQVLLRGLIVVVLVVDQNKNWKVKEKLQEQA